MVDSFDGLGDAITQEISEYVMWRCEDNPLDDEEDEDDEEGPDEDDDGDAWEDEDP